MQSDEGEIGGHEYILQELSCPWGCWAGEGFWFLGLLDSLFLPSLMEPWVSRLRNWVVSISSSTKRRCVVLSSLTSLLFVVVVVILFVFCLIGLALPFWRQIRNSSFQMVSCVDLTSIILGTKGLPLTLTLRPFPEHILVTHMPTPFPPHSPSGWRLGP